MSAHWCFMKSAMAPPPSFSFTFFRPLDSVKGANLIALIIITYIGCVCISFLSLFQKYILLIKVSTSPFEPIKTAYLTISTV